MSVIQQNIVAVGCATFGKASMQDRKERMLRFLEEAVELVRAGGLSREEIERIVDFEFGRPVETEIRKEFGGAGVTLYAAADAYFLDLDSMVLREINRVDRNKEKIREKSKAKPDAVHSTRGIG